MSETGKTVADLMTLPPLTVEADRVVMTGDDGLANAVIFDQLDYAEDDEMEAAYKSFSEQFEIVGPRTIMGNPDEDFYQGIDVMSVIRRRSDGRKFGFKYWKPISKHGEAFIEANGDDEGFGLSEYPAGTNWDEIPSVFVWLPVEPFTITGYALKRVSE